MGFWFLDFSLNFELFAKFSMNSMKKNVYSYLVCYKNFKSLFSYWVEIEKSFFLLNRTCFWDRIYNIMQQEYAHGNFDKRILPGWLTIETSLGIFSKQKRKGVDRESRDDSKKSIDGIEGAPRVYVISEKICEYDGESLWSV